MCIPACIRVSCTQWASGLLWAKVVTHTQLIWVTRNSSNSLHLGKEQNTCVSVLQYFLLVPYLWNPHQVRRSVTAVAIPRVTSELITSQTCSPECNLISSRWSRLWVPWQDRQDILLRADIYAKVISHCWRNGPPGSPVTFKTKFSWVRAGKTNTSNLSYCNVTSHHVSVASSNELLRKFWEVEEKPQNHANLSPEKRIVVKHFEENHHRSNTGRFIVPLPRKPQARF